MTEIAFQCPYCWEQITVLVDTSIREQTYVEDCEVCCNPMELSVSCTGAGIGQFEARQLGQ